MSNRPTANPPFSDRAGFLMGNPDREESRGLTVLSIGTLDQDAIEPLAALIEPLATAEISLPADISMEMHPEEINTAIDRARSHWVFIIRRGERISDVLAEEIISSAVEPPLSWGFRVRSETLYRGRPLRLERRNRGEIRLLHRRHARFDLRTRGSEMKVQGTVLRIREPLKRVLFESAEEHAAWLRSTAVPHSGLRRSLLFLRRAIETGALWRSANALRYLWMESGWDRGTSTLSGESR